MVYNADGSMGPRRLLFAINPGNDDVRIPIGPWADLSWRQVADQERCQLEGIDTPFPIDDVLYVPLRGCGAWVLNL